MKRNWPLRIFFLVVFAAMSAFMFYTIYSLSDEDGYTSGYRSQTVTQQLQQQVQEHFETTTEGIELKERLQYFVIMHSPYGSDWNANVRKLAHFSIYFVLAAMCYITLALLGVGKISRILLTLMICGGYAYFDEIHQSGVWGRAMSETDVMIDTLGACSSILLFTLLSILGSMVRGIFGGQHD
ncbi:MAG: VanZ family protein [Erysipelotrichaceae bacterium]|nr:VanZ family protein [Erysipelotrichaceae bacterium]